MNPSTFQIETKTKEHLTWLEIDQDALVRNFERLKELTMPAAEIFAVIKANAYGHGLLEVARVLEKKAAYFGVASIHEALRLRQFEIQTPILLFGIHLPDDIKRAIEARITLSVSSLDQALETEAAAAELGKSVVLHVKVDTGMGRLGIPLRDAKETILKIRSMPHLQLEGIYTHFPIAEKSEDPFTAKQVQSFHLLMNQLSDRGVSFAYRHAANSAALFFHKEAHFNLVRPGISLYGILPEESLTSRFNPEPVLKWKSRVILTKSLRKGETVGYGQTFVAEEKTAIAILPVGYSHGYSLALSNKADVLIYGKRCRVVGRVSMDYLAVQVKEDSVKSGDIATLIGRDGQDTVRAEELAARAGTIPYEIVTRIHPELPRLLVS